MEDPSGDAGGVETAVKITIGQESDPQRWEANSRASDASVFLSRPWLESLRTSYRAPVYLRFSCDKEPVGLAAGLTVEPAGRPFRRALSRLYRPFILFSGPAILRPDRSLASDCIQELINFAADHNHTHLVLGSWDYPQMVDFELLPLYRVIRDEYIVDLRGDWRDIRQSMRKEILRQTRRATRSGLTFVERDTANAIDDLIALLEQTRLIRLSKGYADYSYYYMPYLDRPLLFRLLRNKIARIFSAQLQDRILCMHFILVHGNRAYALLIGTNSEGYRLRAPAFLMFHTIKTLKEEGIDYLNLGGVPPDSSRDRLVFAKTALGAKRHVCSGGATRRFNGTVINLLNTIYMKMPDRGPKHFIERVIVRNRR
jgi:hypothetical protein